MATIVTASRFRFHTSSARVGRADLPHRLRKAVGPALYRNVTESRCGRIDMSAARGNGALSRVLQAGETRGARGTCTLRECRAGKLVCEGHWENVERKELVCAGHWEERRVAYEPRHEDRPARESVSGFRSNVFAAQTFPRLQVGGYKRRQRERGQQTRHASPFSFRSLRLQKHEPAKAPGSLPQHPLRGTNFSWYGNPSPSKCTGRGDRSIIAASESKCAASRSIHSSPSRSNAP